MKIANWGLFPFRTCSVNSPVSYEEIKNFIEANDYLIARGNGRCYGDASLSKNVVSTLQLNKIIDFNEREGTIHCQAGVLLSTILTLIVPKGFFIPVSPGTKFITVGGAFASDIHGKNHHIDGVFSDHVTMIKLMNKDGEIVDLFPDDELFAQTAGGMGLTGIILEVVFSLKKIESAYIKQTAIRARNLQEVFRLFEENKHYPYSVAWIDCLATNNEIGKSVLLLGAHATKEEADSLKLHAKVKWNIPFYFPTWVLNFLFVKLFNAVYYHKPSSNQQNQLVHYDDYFYPLDKVGNWNKIYGRNGFIQYQCVLPEEHSYKGLQQILEILSRNKLGSFLAVLKKFGESKENRFLHFPLNGYTLALDIKVSKKIWPILDELDQLVTALGGKIYLTKDARLKMENYQIQYPNRLETSNKFMSYQSERLMTKNENVFLILGANSDIAKAIIQECLIHHPNTFFVLASKNIDGLENLVKELNLSNQAAITYFDARDVDEHANFVKQLAYQPKWILYAVGILVENEKAMASTAYWLESAMVNYMGAVSIINELVKANYSNLEKIIGVSSIAGLRGRKSNFMYGASKAGFHAYLFGLRQELKEKGIVVQAITPGFVDTKMTQHLILPNNAVKPAVIAKALFQSNKNAFEIYPNLYWKLIGNLIKILPEFVISKL